MGTTVILHILVQRRRGHMPQNSIKKRTRNQDLRKKSGILQEMHHKKQLPPRAMCRLVCVCVCVYVCMYVCMYVCVCVCRAQCQGARFKMQRSMVHGACAKCKVQSAKCIVHGA